MLLKIIWLCPGTRCNQQKSLRKTCITNLFPYSQGTTATTTTTPTPSGCGNPDWANDEYCDDENNNPSCNFDGGACCNNNFSGWNQYCQVIYNHAFLINNPCLTYSVIFAEV